MTQTYRFWIKASPEQIWQALPDPETLARYGYGGRYELDLQPRGSYRVGATEQMLAGGAPELMVEGEVLEVDAPNRFVQSWHPLFELEPGAGGVTKLTVTHELEDAPLAAAITSGEAAEAGGGFPWVLSDLKTLLETGEALPPQMGA